MTLTRDQIFAIDDIKIEKVNIPEWGGEVWVKGFTGAERDAFEISIMEFREGKKPKLVLENMRAKLCVMTVCDEKGNRIFKDGDIPALGKKAAKALSVIFDKAQELNGLSDEDVEKLSKNSESAPAEDSTSD